MAEAGGRGGHVAAHGVKVELAHLGGLERRQLGGVLLDEVGRAHEDATPLGAGHPRPHAGLEGLPRRGHGVVHVLGAACGEPGDGLLGGGVEGVDRLAGRRGDGTATDPQVGVGQGQRGDLGECCGHALLLW